MQPAVGCNPLIARANIQWSCPPQDSVVHWMVKLPSMRVPSGQLSFPGQLVHFGDINAIRRRLRVRRRRYLGGWRRRRRRLGIAWICSVVSAINWQKSCLWIFLWISL